MSETDTIPVSASIASTGLGIRYIGNYAYAYSGETLISTTETNLIKSTSGSGFIVAKIQFNYGRIDSNNDIAYVIWLNSQRVFSYTVSGSMIYTEPDNIINIIIPPFTEVKLTARNRGSGTEYQYAVLIGRVYGAE